MRTKQFCAFALVIVPAGLIGHALVTKPARASEIFICNDGRTIQLNASNREKYRNDPCVAEWFKTQKSAVESEKAKATAAPQKMQGIPARCKKPWDCPHLD